MRRGILIIGLLLLGQAKTFAAPVMLDTELDHWFHSMAAPLQQHMPLTHNARFVLVVDDALNAYVTGSNIIHIHSGLILASENAAELQGVIAHEMGHIAGRHVDSFVGQMNTASIESIAGAILGIGAVAAGAPGNAGAAIMATSQAGAISGLLRHSRTQESDADRRALSALHNAGLSGKPLVSMLGKLRTDAQLSYSAPPPYLLTHPLPANRMTNLEQDVSTEPSPTLKLSALADATFQRIQAKTFALSRSPQQTLRRYTGSTESDQYARVIAYARQGKLREADAALAPLLANAPQDPFYLETRGLIALDAGKLDAAEQDLARVLQNHPGFLYVRYQLAEVYRAQNTPQKALPLLEDVTRDWPQWPTPWQSLGITYGQLGRIPESHLALTEQALARSDKTEARTQLAYANNYLKKSPNPQAKSWAVILKSRLDKMSN